MKGLTHWIKDYKFSLLLVAVVLFLSFFNPPQTGLDEVTGMDKVAHFGMYFALAGVVWAEYTRRHASYRRLWLALGAVLMPIVLGGLVEVGQAMLTGYRSGDWMDWVADMAGVAVMTAVAVILERNGVWQRLWRGGAR
mgnify:CR=1 FL=1